MSQNEVDAPDTEKAGLKATTSGIRLFEQLRSTYRGCGFRLFALAAVALGTALTEVATLSLLVPLVAAISTPGDAVFRGTLPILKWPVALSANVLIGMCLTAVAARAFCQVFGAYVVCRITTTFEARKRRQVLDAFLQSTWACQSQEKAGHMQHTLTTHVEAASNVLQSLGTCIASSASFLVMLGSAFVVNPWIALAISVLTVVLGLIARPLSVLGRKYAKQKVEAYHSFVNSVSQGAPLARELRVFGSERRFAKRVGGFVDAIVHARRSQVFLMQLVPAMYQTTCLLVVVAGLATIYYAELGNITSLSVVVLLLLRAMTYGQTFQSVLHSIYDGLPHLEHLDRELERYETHRLDPSGETLAGISGLEFADVSFAYRPGEWVLRHVNFGVNRGEMIGIVGPSGSGKTTLMQLLQRLREPTQGLVLVNGQPAATFSQASWHQRVSFVPQEPVMFNESIEECIRFMRPDITRDQVEQAAKKAGIYDEIMDFPQGFSSFVGERGGNLSGGQRQRVCIARALVGKPDVIVLDEPTSALDVHSEAVIIETLGALKRQATVFIIAHRLSTLNVCDKVMVLRNGEIEAFGDPEELAKDDSYFSEALRLAQVS